MKSKDYWKYFKNPLGTSITIAHSGSAAVTAKAYPGGLIEIDFVDLGSSEYLTMNTPFSFEVVDYWVRVDSSGNVSSKTLTLQNGSDAISSAVSMATDKGFARPTTMDNTYASFTDGDNDLKLVSSAHADGDAVAYLLVKPV